MTITMEDMMSNPKGYTLRLKKGGVLSLSNWWIFRLEAEGVYLLDQGGWGGPGFSFKLGDDGHCLANTQEGWIDIGVFEKVTGKDGGHDQGSIQDPSEGQTSSQNEDQSDGVHG